MTDCARNAHDEPGRSRVSMTAEGHVRARTPQPKARRGAGESARDDTDLRVPDGARAGAPAFRADSHEHPDALATSALWVTVQYQKMVGSTRR